MVLLSTSMFVGGVVGFVLDNTIPGTAEERGIVQWKAQLETTDDVASAARIAETYDIPLVTRYLRRVGCLRYVPVCPTFTGCGRGGRGGGEEGAGDGAVELRVTRLEER